MLKRPQAPSPPRVRLALGVTGHREENAAFAANRARIEATLASIFDRIEAVVRKTPAPFGPDSIAPTRLHTLLTDGADQLAARNALARGWDLTAPLPFGRLLNVAINALPTTPEDARALLAGAPAIAPEVQSRASSITELADRARLFELADRDAEIATHFLARLEAPGDFAVAQAFAAVASERVALAARLMIEQSDILIAVWDGASQHHVGGTGHTVAFALALGAPVLWIDAKAPESWRILRAPESLAVAATSPAEPERQTTLLENLVRDALQPLDPGASALKASDPYADAKALGAERWRKHSNPLWHAYRRVEALFGGGNPWRNLRQTYESPDAIAAGSGATTLAALRHLPGADTALANAVEISVLRRYAWADGVSSRLSDTYRGGMTANFVLSAAAIFAGISYLPFVKGDDKGMFAAVEFLLLAAILCVTWLGTRRRWHARWFETRRVAEYLRHSPILLALGVARPPGRWPKGSHASWPEWYARHGLREVGLPRVALTQDYLRAALKDLLDDHVVRQRDYHTGKALRLSRVHVNLGRLSELFFQLAVVFAAVLTLTAAGLLKPAAGEPLALGMKWFTLLGVILPAFGAAVSGVRYFGDFERFGAISAVTAGKLDALHARIALLLSVPTAPLDYDRVSELAHCADDIVVSEIESWQAVFGGKHVTVPA